MTVSKATQLFSRHVAMGFKHYREKKETATDFKCNTPYFNFSYYTFINKISS